MDRLEPNTGLVLEGGGMRGVFTSGVLDAMMKHELYFGYVVAVSAGACNGMSYIIGQREKPRPIVKVTQDTGTPDGDPAVFSVEIQLYAQKSLIPCEI